MPVLLNLDKALEASLNKLCGKRVQLWQVNLHLIVERLVLVGGLLGFLVRGFATLFERFAFGIINNPLLPFVDGLLWSFVKLDGRQHRVDDTFVHRCFLLAVSSCIYPDLTSSLTCSGRAYCVNPLIASANLRHLLSISGK